jgi:hypothetical protein
MNKLVGVLLLGPATLVAACMDAPEETAPPPSDLPVPGTPQPVPPGGGPLINGSSFTCTGSWPSPYTPCQYPNSTRSVTTATGSDGRVTLALSRDLDPSSLDRVPVEAAGSTVYIDLDFNTPNGATLFSVREITLSSNGTFDIEETSTPISGWVGMIYTSRDPAGRNAGRFSLEFTWGSMAGTYDTDPPTFP